ncbi:hypothetical protein LPICM17_40002 [Lactococcus piscium]|nr:hypothetical protein LPICM17_40002 [Lactococcus piscium]
MMQNKKFKKINEIDIKRQYLDLIFKGKLYAIYINFVNTKDIR